MQGTHPELLEWTDDVNVQIDLYGRHSRFIFPVGTPSPRLGQLGAHPALAAATSSCAGVGHRPARPSPARRRREARGHRRDAAASARQLGMDLSALRDEQLLDDYHYTIFPNVTLNMHGRGFWLFRHRPHPTDPNRMLFDFQDYLRWPASLGAARAPAAPRGTCQGGTSLGIVLDQDLYNLPRVQAGHALARVHRACCSGAQERRIRHFHRTLDGYVGTAGSSAR